VNAFFLLIDIHWYNYEKQVFFETVFQIESWVWLMRGTEGCRVIIDSTREETTAPDTADVFVFFLQ